MTKKEKELTREFLIPYVTEFKYCFSTTTSKKWKEKFCNDRMENFIEDFSETFTNQTKIKLDCGVYACLECLNVIGAETNNVRNYVSSNNFSDKTLNNFISLLNVMKDNNIYSIDNAIKTIEAIKMYDSYINDDIDKKNKESFNEIIDFFVKM